MKHWTVTSNDGRTFLAVADEAAARELAEHTPAGATVELCSCGAEDVHSCTYIPRAQPGLRVVRGKTSANGTEGGAAMQAAIYADACRAQEEAW